MTGSKCTVCKRKQVRPCGEIVDKNTGEKILLFFCASCGTRSTFGDPYLSKGMWPRAQAWLESDEPIVCVGDQLSLFTSTVFSSA